MAWHYNPDQYNENKAIFNLIPAGRHRIRIEDAEETISKNSGRDMIKLTFSVSGHQGKLFHYLVFLEENPEMTNQRIGELYNCFGIAQKLSVSPQTWIGKVGAAQVRHEDVNGKTYAKVAFFIKRRFQDDLPAWIEGNDTVSPKDMKVQQNPMVSSAREDILDVSDLPEDDDADTPF